MALGDLVYEETGKVSGIPGAIVRCVRHKA